MIASALSSVDPALLQDLVDANHILFNQGVVDAFGHVSVRHDKHADHFLLARNMAPGAWITGALCAIAVYVIGAGVLRRPQ